VEETPARGHEKTTVRVRDREATRKQLLQAVGTILARQGFATIGVNAVAREARVDKVLIYRYFGSLQGLIGAFGREGDFWPTIEELAGGDLDSFLRLPLPERFSTLARMYVRGLRKRPLTQEILAWEMVERNDLTFGLEALREATHERMLRIAGEPVGATIDIEAVSALIGAAINYLVTRSGRSLTVFGGVDISSEQGWQRLERVLDSLIKALFAASEKGG